MSSAPELSPSAIATWCLSATRSSTPCSIWVAAPSVSASAEARHSSASSSGWEVASASLSSSSSPSPTKSATDRSAAGGWVRLPRFVAPTTCEGWLRRRVVLWRPEGSTEEAGVEEEGGSSSQSGLTSNSCERNSVRMSRPS